MKELPQDIGGYQHLAVGIATQRGDIWVGEGRPQSFVDIFLYPEVIDTSAAKFIPDWRIYRKMPVPYNSHDEPRPSDVLDAWQQFADGMAKATFIPQDDAKRKMAPIARGVLGYFPAAIFEVATHSMESDLKHNPGNTDGPTWARNKSSDHADCICRHLIDAGMIGTKDRKYHLRALAWRALALLQEECEREGMSPGISSR